MFGWLWRLLRMDWPKPQEWDMVQRLRYERGKQGYRL